MTAPTSPRIPSYRHYKPKDLAVVRLAGRDHYLGKFNSPESWRRYHELIAAFLARGETAAAADPPPSAAPSRLPLKKLCLDYYEFTRGYYVRDGKPTSEVDCIRYALRRVLKLYGDVFADDFGPKALKEVREELIRDGQARTTVNSNISRIRRMFRWATENELLPVTVYQSLLAVSGLRKGRTNAPDAAPVLPVDDVAIEAALPHLAPPVAAMVRLQRLTGCRPAEICSLRPCDIDRSGDVWCYRPESHKTAHHGHERRIYLGPRCQEVLAPYLDRAPDAFCFSPAEAKAMLNAQKRKKRKSPLTPSQAARRPKATPKRAPGDHYTSCSYRRAVERACEKAKITTWHPNQLRHARATELRKQFGLESAQVVLGHSEATVTQIYAERNFGLAERLMREMG